MAEKNKKPAIDLSSLTLTRMGLEAQANILPNDFNGIYSLVNVIRTEPLNLILHHLTVM